MLTIYRRANARSGNRLSRRGFLQIGALTACATSLDLTQVLRADTAQPGRRHKSVINIFLAGGPPHQDLSLIHI